MNRWRIGLPGLILSLLATGALVAQLDLDSLLFSLRTAKYGWLLPAFLLLLTGQLVRALRWRALLDGGLSLADIAIPKTRPKNAAQLALFGDS